MTKDIEPKLKLIKDFLKLNKNEKFIIPEYQRGYTWEKEQCEKLWQDIQDFLNAGNDDPYFFGTIIIDVDEQNNTLNLIDGQQRTTTFLLLLKALQLILKKLITERTTSEQDQDSNRIYESLKDFQKKSLEILFKADGDLVYDIQDDWNKTNDIVLLTNNSINEIHPDELDKIIKSEDYSSAEQKVFHASKKQNDNKYTNHFKNFKFFYEKLSNCKILDIKAFSEIFLNKCQVIEIRSWQVEQAITMFNSLNSTGTPLTDADIISAKLYSNCNNDTTKKTFDQKWKEFKELTDKLDKKNIIKIGNVLQEYMYIKRSADNVDDTHTPGVRKYYTNINTSLLQDPEDLCNQFLKIADIWNKIIGFPEIKLLLKFNDNAKLYLISYLYRFDVDKITRKKIKPICECLLRLFAILELSDTSYSSAKFKSFLFNVNNKLVDAHHDIKEIIKDFNAHINNNWQKEEIVNSLNSYKRNALVYLHEYLFANENNLEFNFYDNVNIEHIMPKSGRDIETIRKDADIQDQEEFYSVVDSLGNKIFLEESINKSIGRDWFKSKKNGYKKSKYNIAKSLGSSRKNKWTKDDISNATNCAINKIVCFIFNEKKPAKKNL